MIMESERLARMEEKLDGLTNLVKAALVGQEDKNRIFFSVRDKVNILEATARATWKTLAALGTISAALGAGFAWVVEHPPRFLSSPAFSTGSQGNMSDQDNFEQCCSRDRRFSSPSSEKR